MIGYYQGGHAAIPSRCRVCLTGEIVQAACLAIGTQVIRRRIILRPRCPLTIPGRAQENVLTTGRPRHG